MNEIKILTKQKMLSIKNLLQKKYREDEGMFIVEGWKSIEEAAIAGIAIESIIYDAQKIEGTTILTKFNRSTVEIFAAKTKELESISDTVTSQGIIAVLPTFTKTTSIVSVMKQPSAVIVVLDAINDPGNLGTIIRTCDWFGVDALIIGKNSVDVYNPKVVRASMGSMFHFPILDETNLDNFLTTCQLEKFTIYSTELTKSDDVRKISFPKKCVVIIGNESHGVSPEISVFANKKIRIPQFGKAESLNAAMACGIILSKIKL